MKKNWKEITIGDLGQVITGNTPPKKDSENYGGSYPFIKPTDMDIDKRHVTSWEENYSEKAFKKYKNSYIPPKATGVVTIGTVGQKIFQADQHCFTNQSVNVVIPSENYDEDFVFYLLKYNLPKVENANPGTASGRHHVSKSNFCAIKVDVPNLIIQRKIGAILSVYDDLIENNLKRIKLLEEKAQRTYEEWFVKMRFPGYENAKFDEVTKLPEGWENMKVNFLLEKVKSVTKIKTSDILERGKIPVIDQSRNFIAGYTNDKTSIIEIFKPLIVFGDHTRCLKFVNFSFARGADGTQLILSNNKRMPQHLFYHVLMNIDLSNYHYARHFKFLKECEIILPDFNTSNKYEIVVKPIFDLIDKFRKQNHLLKEERDILLPRLMNGIIDVEQLKTETVKV
ncbi:restriction endonuclease subunit S [Flavobacterium anhuiense]|uniref:restriction endonuclease subunit S n=1 Tax=Flavobacterium anhuiense TaxID=459526 RepID=UPI0034D987B0